MEVKGGFMTEDINNSNTPQGDVNNQDDPQGGSQNQPQENKESISWQEIAGLDPKEFDSPEKLAQTYKEARKGLSEQGQKLKDLENFKSQVEPFLQAVYQDKELYDQISKRLGGEKETKDDKKDKPAYDPRVDEIQSLTEQQIIKEFEKESGISKLAPEKQAELRAKIGENMREWIGNGRVDLQRLPKYLNDAFDLVKARGGYEAPQEETIEIPSYGFGSPRAAQAAIKGMSVSSLSPAELKAAKASGLTAEEYLQQKKEIMSEAH